MNEFERLKQTYFEECDVLLEELDRGLGALQGGESGVDLLNAVFRAVHSIKGGAGAFGLKMVVGFADAYETVLGRLRDGRLPAGPQVTDILVRAGDMLAALVAAETGGPPGDAAREAQIRAALIGLLGEDGAAAPADDSAFDLAADLADDSAEGGQGSGGRSYVIHFTPTAETYASGSDPLPIIRELKRMGGVQVEADMTALPALDAMAPDGSYLSWTIQLETAADIAEIREAFAFVEDSSEILIEALGDEPDPTPETPLPSSPTPPPASLPAPAAIAQPPAPDAPPAEPAKPAGGRAPGRDSQGSIRVDLEKIERLLSMVGELAIAQATMAQQAGGLPGAFATLRQSIDDLSRHTRELQESVMSIRAQPIRAVFQRIPRLVREVATESGKSIALTIEGEETEIDKTVVERLYDPLVHLLRNGIDHGIETPEERVAAGKPPQGLIHLSAEQRSGRILIQVSDDGRGINRKKVMARAQERGLVPRDAVLSDEEIDDLIFLPGFSTAEKITTISGRGVGMDAVRHDVSQLGGRVMIRSEPGKGSAFILILPLTLAVMDGMLVRVGQETYVVPLANVIESLRPEPDTLRTLMNVGEVLAMRGEYLRIAHVGRLFGIRGAIEDPARGLILLAEAEDGRRLGLVVDDVMGQQQVVVKSVEANYGRLQGVAAATILGNGRVSLILDVAGIYRLLEQERSHKYQRSNERAYRVGTE
jgi:two-component system chemotaxis sensor kinase CheA